MIVLFMCAISLLTSSWMVSYPLWPSIDRRGKVKYDAEKPRDFTLCITRLPIDLTEILFNCSSTESPIFNQMVNLSNSAMEIQVTIFYLLLPLAFHTGIQHFLPVNNHMKFEMQILKDLPYNQFPVLCGYRLYGYFLLLCALTFKCLNWNINEPTFENWYFLMATVDY